MWFCPQGQTHFTTVVRLRTTTVEWKYTVTRFAIYNRNCELRESQKDVTRGSGILQLKLKSLIMAQIERWRQALYMQVER